MTENAVVPIKKKVSVDLIVVDVEVLNTKFLLLGGDDVV